MSLGFFKDVKVNREPGSAPDRVVVSRAGRTIDGRAVVRSGLLVG